MVDAGHLVLSVVAILSILSRKVPHMGLQLLRHLPAGDGHRSKHPGELVVRDDDPAIPRVLEAEVFDVEPHSL